MLQGTYFQHFLFFSSYEYFQQARVLYYTRPKKLASDKQSNLLDPFVSYEQNNVFVNTSPGVIKTVYANH